MAWLLWLANNRFLQIIRLAVRLTVQHATRHVNRPLKEAHASQVCAPACWVKFEYFTHSCSLWGNLYISLCLCPSFMHRIHLLATSLGTPVQQLDALRSRRAAEVQPEHQHGEEMWLRWLCWYQAGWPEYFRLLIFPHKHLQGSQRLIKKRKISVQQLPGRKCFVYTRGQRRTTRVLWVDRKATVTQITPGYNQSMQKSTSVALLHLRKLEKRFLLWWVSIFAVNSDGSLRLWREQHENRDLSMVQ